MTAKTKTLATVNNVSILLIENGQKLVPIKPICEALGIAHQTQIEKVKSDEILSSVVSLSLTTGADGKQYEMTCIPFKFVFGGIFTINPKNVKHEAQEALIRYKLQCYEVLYKNFTEQAEFLEEKQEVLRVQMDKVARVRKDFRNAQHLLKEETAKLNEVKDLTFEQWQANRSQLSLDL